MLKTILATSFLGLVACATPSDGPAVPPSLPILEYVVRIPDPSTARAEVELTLTGLPAEDGPLFLRFPERFAFVRLDEPLLEGEVRAFDGPGEEVAVERVGPHRWSAERPESGPLRLRWTVPHRHRDLPEVRERDAYEYPYLADDHGMLVAGTLFLTPDLADGRARIRFELPEGWPVRCPWPEVEPGVFAPAQASALHNDLIAIGTWEEQVIEANGCEVTIAVAPDQTGLMKAAGPLIERIVCAEIELFGCVPREKYLFLFGRPDPPMTLGSRGTSMAGSPKTGSMTLMVRGWGRLGLASHLGHLIAHEFHHTWTNNRLGLPDELRWVGEGFTDYYAFLVLAREELAPWERFAKTIEEKLSAYAGNPVRSELSLAEAGGPPFYSDRNAYSLVYDGGFLLAALFDRLIRADNEAASLDDFLRAFNNDPRWSAREEPPSSEDFYGELGHWLPEETVARLSELVSHPREIDFVAELLATDVEITAERRPEKLSLRANLDGTRVRDIDPAGLGGRLGLRAGDVLLEVNGVACDTVDGVQRAWRQPRDGRMCFTFERDGQRHEVDEPIPEALVVTVDPEPWRSHLPTDPPSRADRP